MKKRKKIIALTLSITLGTMAILGSVPLIYRGVNKVVGTDAAKILLARENMNNASSSFDWKNMFSEKQATPNSIEPISSTSSANTIVLSSSQSENLGTLVHDSPAGKVYLKNGEYNFQNISGASYQGLVVESRLADVDFRVENAAKNINYLKNELNIVNKWVKDGNSKFYLDVTSNRETLFEYYEDKTGQKSLWVVERETREDANSVYSLMFTDMSSGKVNNPTFLVYIPNERYEYYYGHDGNSTDYLIAEQDKGYWNVFMPNESNYYNVTVNDDFAFESSGSYSGEGDDYGVISTSNLKEDVISHYSTGIYVHLSAFNGISGIFAPEEFSFVNTYDGGTKTYIDVNHQDRNKIKIGLNNGNFLRLNDEFIYDSQSVKISTVDFEFFSNPGFADPQYDVSISLDMGEGLSLKQKLSLFERFLSDNGLTSKYDLNEIEKNIIKNSQIANSITSFYTWNGYLMNSPTNFKSAESVIFSRIDKMFAEYEKVKDAETVNKFFSARVARRQTFAGISNLTYTSTNYLDGKVQIDNISITVEKSKLLEENKKYKLQIGLARIDDNGNYLSQNTVNLNTLDAVASETYGGNDLTLTASGEYELPTALEENRYVVVAYAVTEDEGIRVSEMKSIAFIDAANDTIETSNVLINVQSVNENLVVEYTSKLYFNVTVSGEITYGALRRKMMAELLKHGYPMDNEEITTSSGGVVTETTAISIGEYKLKFVISTIDGPVTAYVVCSVTA